MFYDPIIRYGTYRMLDLISKCFLETHARVLHQR